MGRRTLLGILAVTSALSQVGTVVGAGGELVPYQFANFGVEFGYKEILVEARKNTRNTSASYPTIDTPQKVLTVEHPKYVLEKVFKKVAEKDGRARIESTTHWPYSVFGQLQMQFTEGTYQGSGTLVSPHHVLTCAHNVYDPETKRWAKEIKFTPALDGTQAPFGVVPVINAFIYKAWEESGASEADIALLTLAQPIGEKTGWAGLMTMDTRATKMAIPEITGYPGDKGGTQMWKMYNEFASVSETQFSYVIDTAAGQSGSGIWIRNLDEPYVLGVHIAASQAREENIGTRISLAYFETLHHLMAKTGEMKAVLVRPMSSAGTSSPIQQSEPATANLTPSIQAATVESAAKCNRKGMNYKYGLGGLPEDLAKAVEWYTKAAEQGDENAQYNLGGLYNAGGSGLPKDLVKAVEWYTKAAEQGNVNAQHAIGNLYKEGGPGLPKDLVKAVEWYTKAAEQGNANAQRALGGLYKEGGPGLPKDYAKAVECYTKAAEQGDEITQYELGELYKKGGPGLPKDYAKAVECYTKAAEQGYAGVQYQLGELYEEGGPGLPRDLAKAVEWYTKAAEQGDEDAQYKLGSLYEKGGPGLPKDYAKAVEWYTKAAEQGSGNAQSALKNLRKLMGSERE